MNQEDKNTGYVSDYKESVQCQERVPGESIWNADVFVPEIRIGVDEILHHLDTTGIVEDDEIGAGVFEPILTPLKSLVFTNDNPWNLEKDGGAGAHRTGRERGDECQGVPIPSSASISYAVNLSMRSRIIQLDALVVSGGDDGPISTDQCSTNGNATL